MPLRAVGFDLWETLITDTPELARRQERLRLERMEAILAASGHLAARVRIERAYRAGWSRCNDLYWSAHNDVPCRRQIELFLEALELDVASMAPATLDQLEHVYAHAAVEIPPAVLPGAAALLAGLRARGLSLGLISNTGRTPGYALRQILEQADLGGHFDAMLFSDEQGICKPQPAIFEELRGRLGVSFEEMIFVGDNLHVDVWGAQRCGMRGVHFVPSARGLAVAPPFLLDQEVVPDARIERLEELVPLVGSMRR